MDVDVILPDSKEAAAAAYGDGSGISVMAGGTILMQLVNYRRSRPDRVLMLHKAGLSYMDEEGSTVTIGAMTPLARLTGLDAPLGPCAANIGDPEIRAQATLGGNLCAPTPPEHPSGDLQGALIALGATVRSAGAGGERTETVEEFLPHRDSRLVLEVSYERPAAGAFAALHRPHTRHFTPLAVSAVRSTAGEIRLAATGVGPTGIRLPSAEAAAADPAAAGAAAVADVEPADDALLSAWYRERALRVLVERVLTEIGEAS